MRHGDLSALECVTQALEALATPASGAAVTDRLEDSARQQATQLDTCRERGETLGPLAGVPFAVKENICTLDGRSACGSRSLAGHRSPFEATAVDRLRRAGAIMVAKTCCDEFGMGSSGEHCAWGPTTNPWDPERVPGGSSSGSAIVVARGAVPLALGSDTGGSARQPAAFCGLVGVKPNYGRVSRWGLVAFASSLDTIAPMTRTVSDAALALRVMAGHDPHDESSSSRPVPDFESSLGKGVSGLRVGLIREFRGHDSLHPAIAVAVDRAARDLEAAGAELREISLPVASYGLPIYYLLSSAEASSNLSRYDGVRYGVRSQGGDDLLGMYEKTRGESLGPEVKRRIMLGTYALSAGYYDEYYGRALRARAVLRSQVERQHRELDLLLCPTTPQPAFRLGEKTREPLEMYEGDLFTVLASLTGQPALTIPAPERVGGLPLGVQLIARPFDEMTLFRAARTLEQAGFRSGSLEPESGQNS